MAQLDERTRSDLARLRDRAAPSDAAKQRMYAGLEAMLGPDDGGDDDPGGDPGGDPDGALGSELLGNGSTGLAWAAKLVGATAGLTVAGLATLRVGVALVRALSSAPQPEPPRADAAEPQPIAITSTLPERDSEALVADEAALDEAAASDPPSAPPPAAAKTGDPPEQKNTLAAELAMLEAAHAAPDPAAALRELDRHLAKFPRGELADERELLRIETLCRLDRLADARELRDRFLLERPKSALRRRLASACPALGEP